ncbi:cyclodeaminase/cyclohydrolase family protein [Agromyces sp. Marseille-P2726]|uniref:cyclodeaminase/cyclohydrolase family protein n=1 Tax=Agromyces sp. Marseille-P2726 TaxID=2709132 RepID=UPI00157132BF|nr:cyclodeaminase/cyclohydrolase family protein [Agromyces sp. Marseille-P2726]
MSADDEDLVASETPLDEWLHHLAQAHGAPGGGAACAVMTAISAALLGMVAGYSDDDPAAGRASARVDRVRRRATAAAETDGERSAAFGAALAMDAGPDRERAVRSTTVEATASSVAVGRLAASLVDEARLLADIGNRHVEADLIVAVEALSAALAGSAATARADLQILSAHRASGDDLDDRIDTFQRDLDELEHARAEVDRLADALR